VEEYGYAADGTRLWKRIDQSSTNVQVWIGNIYEEKGGKTLFHVYAGNQQVCTFEAGSYLDGGSDSSKVGYYYHEDSLNSSSALSSSGGSQQQVNVYYPFGRTQYTTSQPGTFQVSRQFTGQVKDDETGLYYYGSPGSYGRYYDPELGRFIQADTLIPDLSNPQSYNRYSYCVEDPLVYTDPTGHSFWENHNPALLWNLQAWKQLVIGGSATSQPLSPDSVMALRTQYGAPIYTPLHGPNGQVIASPADAVNTVGKNVAGSLLMATPIGGEEKAGVELAEEGAKVLKGSEAATKAGQTVLGKFPDYLKLADQLNAKKFNIPASVWNKMSKAEQWGANQKFLDRAVARGDKFILSNPVKDINNVSGAFRQELDYLSSKGYKLSENGTQMIK
jgi:RHS repeat-associated protein